MKIHPRKIILSEDCSSYEIEITNTIPADHNEQEEYDKILLFRVRRAHEKYFSFRPKKGFVLPGQTKRLTITVLDNQFTKSRLLVKLVLIARDSMVDDFERCWQIGVHTSAHGEVKKLVDVLGLNHTATDDVSVAESKSYDFDLNSDALSEITGLSFGSLPQVSQGMSPAKPYVFTKAFHSKGSHGDNHHDLSKAELAMLNKTYSASQDEGDHSKRQTAPSESKPSNTAIPQELKSQLESKLGKAVDNATLESAIALMEVMQQFQGSAKGVERKEEPSLAAIAVVSKEAPPANSQQEEPEDSPLQHAYSEEGIERYSRLVSMKSSEDKTTYSLEIGGQSVDNGRLVEIVEKRLLRMMAARGKMLAMEVIDTSVTSLSASLCRVLQGDSSEAVAVLQEAFVSDNLRSLTITQSKLLTLDAEVNRFHCLTHLDVSFNRIKEITGDITIPSLQHLNVSHNQLSSLDFLQCLHNLRTLLAVDNKISTLHGSIAMLVSLSNTLTVLDLSDNAVCEDKRYAEETLLALPALKFFDGLAVDGLLHSYTQTTANTSTDSGRRAKAKAVSNKGALLPEFPYNLQRRHVKGDRAQDFAAKVKRALNSRAYQSIRSKYDRQARRQPEVAEREQRSKENMANSQSRSVEYSDMVWETSEERKQPMEDASMPLDSSAFVQQGSYSQIDAFQRGSRIHNAFSDTSTSPPKSRATRYNKVEAEEDPLNTNSNTEKNTRKFNFEDNRPPALTADIRPSGGKVTIVSPKATSLSPRSQSITTLKNPPAYAVQTNASKQRRKSQAVSLVNHWAQHKDKDATSVGSAKKESTLLQPTKSTVTRRQSFGMEDMADALRSLQQQDSVNTSTSPGSRGYHSDPETSHRRRRPLDDSQALLESSFRDLHTKLTDRTRYAMQEDPRYSIWHPRYRVPQPVFGLSKPFLHRKQPDLSPHPTHYKEAVSRQREGFMKLPTRGTFSRASKGLTAAFYPMDYMDLEAIRRQGYFHETIGDIHKESYMDKAHHNANASSANVSVSDILPDNSFPFQPPLSTRSNLSSSKSIMTSTTTNSDGKSPSFVVKASGSVLLSPSKPHRRGSVGKHQSRQYGGRPPSVTNSSVDGGGSVSRSASLTPPPYDPALNNSTSNKSNSSNRRESALKELFGGIDDGDAPREESKIDFTSFYEDTPSPDNAQATYVKNYDFKKKTASVEDILEGPSEGDTRTNAELSNYLQWLEAQNPTAPLDVSGLQKTKGNGHSGNVVVEDVDSPQASPQQDSVMHPRVLAMKQEKPRTGSF